MSDTNVIVIRGKEYKIINEGIDKVVNDDNQVAVILASDGMQYWTADYSCVKDINMLFHPELIKIVMEDMCEDDNFSLDWINENLKLNTKGFESANIMYLDVVWVDLGTRFTIGFDYVNDNTIMSEYVDPLPTTFIQA